MAEIAPVLIQAPPLSSINANNIAPFCFDTDDEIPNVDYSMLISADSKLRSQAIECLGRACLDYGCFTVTNHVVPESLMKKAFEHCLGFFDLTVEEKQEFQPKNPTYKIGWGKPGDHRECLKLVSHPYHHYPTKPVDFSEILQEYCKITHEMAMELLGGISKSLGQEESYIEKAMKLQSGFDICAMNAYPPKYSQSNNTLSLPAHTDPSLLVLVIENINGGFQLQRDGKWINANIAPNSIIVNVGEHLEILTNGKYRSSIHRVMGNNNVRRVTMLNAFGPSLDAFVSPASEFVDQDHPPLYVGQTYAEFWEAKQHNFIEEKIMLNLGST